MIKVALAGQPNCGKSSIFNYISGIYQHIANYPGVTVEKKVGKFSYKGNDIELVDLPGTYSFSSYSLEEKVAKDFIVDENPDLIVNIVDASNLKRNLYFTFQLLEMGIPVVIVLNMSDVAKRRGIQIDAAKLSQLLHCDVIEASAAKKFGKEQILESIVQAKESRKQYEEFTINYEELEDYIAQLQFDFDLIENTYISKRWVALKALEGDKQVYKWIQNDGIEEEVSKIVTKFNQNEVMELEAFVASVRYSNAELIYHKCVVETKSGEKTFTDIVDKFVLNRFLAFPILFLTLLGVYQLSIVYGYKLTEYTWPILASFKNFVEGAVPQPYFIETNILSDLAIWMVNSANALLNYIPIFFILFALIAILEGIGYMPRMAFILDRVFRRYGLHGQSTLPLVLGGAVVGGCAVPGVMATKGIADERARLATILTVPYMNCLAKVPFYTLLLGAFFGTQMAIMMFFIATITIFIALIVAKLMTMTVLQNKESAPFVMELPPYHMPSPYGVLKQALERVWIYIKKVVTIVLAVAVILFVMIQFPGISSSDRVGYQYKMDRAVATFQDSLKQSEHYHLVDSKKKVSDLLNAYDRYRGHRLNASSAEAVQALNKRFEKELGEGFGFISPPQDRELRMANRSLRNLSRERRAIMQEIQNQKIENSLLGMFGKALEPVTKYAGFDWKINVAFLSSFAARESAVATIGSIYESGAEATQRAEESMAQSSGYTPLAATAMIIFMILTPPCIATMIVVKYQTSSYKWMLFAIFFPLTLGLISAISVYQIGLAFDLSGVWAMGGFYAFVAFVALAIGFIPLKNINFKGGIEQ